MSESAVIAVAVFGALVLFYVVFKIIKTAIVALILAVVAAGALYWAMPRLEEQKGLAGQAMRQTMKLAKDAKKATDKASSIVKEGVQTGERLLNKTKRTSTSTQP